MNAPDITIPPAVAKQAAEVENCVRRHPGSTLLVAVGVGIAAVLFARAMTPPPSPRNRAVDLLEDIQHRLADLAKDGRQAISQGADSIGEGIEGLHLDRKLDKITRSFKKLFH